MVNTMTEGKRKTLRELYPHLPDAELSEAQDRIDRYIKLALDVFERLRNESGYPKNIQVLTEDIGRPTLDGERSNQKENDQNA
jgi:hypothetical protein